MTGRSYPEQLNRAAPVVLIACCVSIFCIVTAVSGLSVAAGILPHRMQGSIPLDAVRLLRITLYTIAQAAASTGIAVITGIPAAFFIANRNFPGRRFFASLAAVPLCIPSLLIALGYVTVFGISGVYNRVLMKLFALNTPPLTFLYSFTGIILAQGFYNFPLVMMTVADTWSRVPHEQADCARILGASEQRIFRTITFHQITPAIVSAAIPVFLYCFFSFMIVLLFGTPGKTTLEVELYHAARTTLNFHDARILALIETASAGLIITLYTLSEQKGVPLNGAAFTGNETKRKNISGGAEFFFSTGLGLLILIFFLAPLAGILLNAVSVQAGTQVHLSGKPLLRLVLRPEFRKALVTTLLTGTATGICAVITAFTYASFLRMRDRTGKRILFRIIPMLPMAVSSVVIGFGLTIILRKGSPLILIIAQTALTWPLAFRQIYAALVKIPPNTLEEALLLSPYKIDTVLRIFVPFSLRAMLSAAGFCFAVSAGDATIPLMLAIPGFDTLALYTYRLAGAYRFHEACASGMVLGVLCCAFFATANKIKEIQS
jgi:thiamine transport system permease protein